MINSPLTLQCSNPACLHDNALGQPLCDRCQTPLKYAYLWAVGADAAQVIPGMVIDDRYVVMAPQLWLDTQPGFAVDPPSPLPDRALPYLRLYPHRLHVPEVQGWLSRGSGVLLLRNVPIDAAGKLYPTLEAQWTKAAAVRQVYWLWQLWQLWQPLAVQGVASSLLVADNIRVEGWRVRLRELHADGQEETAPPSLKPLANLWLSWIGQADSPIAAPLRAICQRMQTIEPTAAEQQAIAADLNQLLLSQAAQLPLRTKVVAATTTGPQRAHNEDACYPPPLGTPRPSAVIPQLAVVCDGIGGHAGGEVASQMAVRSLQLQVRALLTEVMEQTEVMTPDVVIQQLAAIVRVVNNLIAAQNDTQGRESRQRMGTTVVMALQLPQQVDTATGAANAHELYLANVGDSRAYWITPRYCQPLSVDDDVAVREVRMGRSFYDAALTRSDAGALTQALGTRDADYLHPTVQRFIVEEDGILLLCSDGLSDNQAIEQSWEELMQPVFKGKLSLEAAVQAWIDLANRRNGHDNTSVVLMHCQVSQETPHLFEPSAAPPLESELTASSRVLLYGESIDEEAPAPAAPPKIRQPLSPWAIRVGSAVLLLVAGALGLWAWRQTNPASFDRTWERVLPPAPEASPSPAPEPSLTPFLPPPPQ